MHPILAERRAIAAYLVAVLAVGAVGAVALVGAGDAGPALAALLALPLAVVHGFGCLASWYVCRSLPLAEAPPARLLAGHLASGGATVALLLAVGHGWAAALATRPSLAAASAVFAVALPVVAVLAGLTYALAVAVHYLALQVEAARAAEARAVEARLLGQEAELRALKAQLDPHFLFNSLNSISGLVVASPHEARRMCALLAELLRESLRVGGHETVALADEVALVERYLAIERIRFGDRLRFTARLGDGCRATRVPPLLLQPLVENAVRHGIAHRVDGGCVTLAAERRDGVVVVTVENPCDADRPRGRRGGIGVANVRRRLAARYGSDASLDVEEGDERFRVRVVVPAGGAS